MTAESGAHDCTFATKVFQLRLKTIMPFVGYLKPDQSVLIPETKAGNYYILARGGLRVEESDSNGNPIPRVLNPYPISIIARAIPFSITHITPDRVGDSRYATVEIRGAEFPRDVTVRLVRPTLAEFAPVSMARVDATRIVAVFDLRNAVGVLYDVQVLHPDGRLLVEPYRLQVEPADPLIVDIGVGGKSQLQIGEATTYGSRSEI